MKILIVASLILLLMPSLSRFTVKSEQHWIDAVTGSSKYQNKWLFGFESNLLIEQSELELWVVRREGEIHHDWRCIRGSLKNMWGQRIGSAHGGTPIIYPLDHGLLKTFVVLSTDEQKAQFIKTMRYGTEEEQQSAVDSVLKLTEK